MRRGTCIALLLLAAPAAAEPALTRLDSPAPAGSAEPRLTEGDDGGLYLSWVEAPAAGRHALRFSTWTGSAWGEPRTIASGADWFANWADVPALAAGADGTLVAHWLVRSGPDKYAYDVWLASSADGGRTWSPARRPYADATPAEHGFVSLVPRRDGRFAVIWLDGRTSAADPRTMMTLRHAAVERDGRVGAESTIDDSVCDCCPTDAARTADGGIVLAYRDRTAAEIRDIYVSRFDGASWSTPAAVHRDRWEIRGCPVNGPAVAAAGSRVAVAWFTMSGADQGVVRVAFSRDGGRTFAPPSRVDEGDPIGRVDVVLLDAGTALVSWIEQREAGASVSVRRVAESGQLAPAQVVVPTSVSRSSGFPRLARHAGRTFLAWTEVTDTTRVRVARLGDP